MDFGWVPSLLCFLIGVLILGLTCKHYLEKTNRPKDKMDWQEALEEEHKLQYVRPTDIPSEAFITIDLTYYPMVSDKVCEEIYDRLKATIKLPMLNLKMVSNKEIKQSYGSQMIEVLATYESNYLEFMDISCEYGNILFEHNYIEEARRVLESCVYYGCSSSKCYKLLGCIYDKMQDWPAIDLLIQQAEINMEDSLFLNKVKEELLKKKL